MRIVLLGLLLSFLWFSCGSEQGDAAETDATEAVTNAAVQKRVQDSLRQTYQKYYSMLPDTFPSQCVSERGKVNPADEALRDTAFFVFREHLREVVADKDIFKLLAVVDEDIKLGFGAENGLKDFIKVWQLESPEAVERSPLWSKLADILSLGGGFNQQGNYFEAPYIGQCWPESADAMEQGVVAGAGVRLRASPGLNTQVVATLSHDIVTFIEKTALFETIGGEEHPWIKVKTMAGKEGFVYGKFFRSPIDMRIGFQRQGDGGWKMVSVLAGD